MHVDKSPAARSRNVLLTLFGVPSILFLMFLSARESYLHRPLPEEPMAKDAPGSINDVDRNGKLNASVTPIESNEIEHTELMDDAMCEWRSDILVGTCFGLRCGTKEAAAVKSAKECSSLCCGLEDKCITWQYREDIGCCIGPVVRLGFEGSKSPHWCEPTPPSPWEGGRKSSSEVLPNNASSTPGPDASSLSCAWGDQIKGQCFGLGPSRPYQTIDECREACCNDEDCSVWQYRQDKGCFYGKSNHCERYEGIAAQPYVGKRKPVDPNRVNREGWLN
uniref:Uncharacterized protein n=1 Tax=Norrisiella sphaerica TaxID=552664 RepID=A0A7S2QSB5_9EUKA|mmetsp:Transcript_1845/g.2613  ORF Transcript_1845/g.2613 Transcript_1845/m.2613 type:complete len:278 (+) Transcript_1845:61-894(+)